MPTHARRGHSRARKSSELITIVLAAVAITVVAVMVVSDRSGGSSPAAVLATVTTVAGGAVAAGEGASAAPTTTAAAAEGQELDAVEGQPVAAASGACLMEVRSLQIGSSGPSVVCVQQALSDEGLYSGPASGSYDGATFAAVKRLQESKNLFVDGLVGRETAIALGVWPEEKSLVVRTPPPAPGAVDALGYRLSSVASTGASAPPLPANSGTGKRVVYDRAGQRVWAVAKDGTIIRSWLVSGSKYANEVPGVHKVYSKSAVSTAWNGKAYLPKMIRYYETKIGHIGFHAIPYGVKDKHPYQTDAELGTRLSGGCQRQANLDAAFLWDFAQIGTPVVVV